MPLTKAPPPASIIPLSTKSAASSGGVRSKVLFTASTILLSVSAIASLISPDVKVTDLGRPDKRCRPLTSGEIREAMADPLNKIVEAVKRTLERTPPELAADIVDRGIMLAGGGALVRGISDLLSHETGIFTHIAENPLLCVVNGCGVVLDDFKKLKRVVDTPDFIRNAIRD